MWLTNHPLKKKNEITDRLIGYMFIYLDVCKQMTGVKLLLLHGNSGNYLDVCKRMINNNLANE